MKFAVAVLVFLTACRPSGPAGGPTQDDPVTGDARPSISTVLASHTDSLMAIPGVVGVGEGEKDGRPTVYVMVERRTAELDAALPDSLDGYEVVVKETGLIEPQPPTPDP